MADNWRLIAALYRIAFMSEGGAAWQETKSRGGKSMTRAIRPQEAITAAAHLLKADREGRKADKALIARARLIIRLAEWHQTGKPGEL